MKVVPECCLTCRYEKRCKAKNEAAKYHVFKCTVYVMSDECLLCCSCPNEKCYDFGKCKPVQEEIFVKEKFYEV